MAVVFAAVVVVIVGDGATTATTTTITVAVFQSRALNKTQALGARTNRRPTKFRPFAMRPAP